MRTFPFVQVDVFTANPLEGNPLAVFTDARGLSDAELQAIAKEMNLSETTFVFPRDAPTERERGHRVRIFTPKEELPFAEHPTLGTAWQLRGDGGASEVVLDLNAGRIPVRFEDRPDEPAFGEMSQAEPQFGATHDPATIERAIGLPDGAIDRGLTVQRVSTGLPVIVTPLRSLEVARALSFDLPRARAYLDAHGARHFYFVTRETVDPAAALHARLKFANGEDPATGSAAGCCIAWAVQHGVVRPDERVMIEQGIEIGRPSRIFARASRVGGRVADVKVGGNVVRVMRGELELR